MREAVRSMIDRRRRVGAVAGGLAAVAGGLSGLLGHHGTDAATSHRYWLIGMSVGVTVGIAVLLLARMRGANRD